LDRPKTFWRGSLHPSLPDIGSIVIPISLLVDRFSRFQAFLPMVHLLRLPMLSVFRL
jgi:hypothetical protein